MKKICLMPKPRVPKFRPDLSARLTDIAEKQVLAKPQTDSNPFLNDLDRGWES